MITSIAGAKLWIHEKWKHIVAGAAAVLLFFAVWYYFIPPFFQYGFLGLALTAFLYWRFPDLRKKVLGYGLPLLILFFLSFFSKAFWGIIFGLFLIFSLMRESVIFKKTAYLHRWKWIPLIIAALIIVYEPYRIHINPKVMVIANYEKEDSSGSYTVTPTFADGKQMTFQVLQFDLIAGLLDGNALWSKFNGDSLEIFYKGWYLPPILEPEIFSVRRLDQSICDDVSRGYLIETDSKSRFKRFRCFDEVNDIGQNK